MQSALALPESQEAGMVNNPENDSDETNKGITRRSFLTAAGA